MNWRAVGSIQRRVYLAAALQSQGGIVLPSAAYLSNRSLVAQRNTAVVGQVADIDGSVMFHWLVLSSVVNCSGR